MTLLDGLHYVAIGNPVSKAVIGTSSLILSRAIGYGGSTPQSVVGSSPAKTLGRIMPPLWKLSGHHNNVMYIVGLSGLSAIVLGAVGNHRLGAMRDKCESRVMFETANRIHFYHTIAMVAAPMSKYPVITGSLMMVGTFLFSGAMYYRAYTDNLHFESLAPIGAFCLLAAWITLIF